MGSRPEFCGLLPRRVSPLTARHSRLLDSGRRKRSNGRSDLFPVLPNPSMEARAHGRRALLFLGRLHSAVAARRRAKYVGPTTLGAAQFALLFEREAANNDGIVGRYSSHLGKVIRSDYPLDHLATVNQTTDTVRKDIDPVQLYVEHAALLFRKGL